MDHHNSDKLIQIPVKFIGLEFVVFFRIDKAKSSLRFKLRIVKKLISLRLYRGNVVTWKILPVEVEALLFISLYSTFNDSSRLLAFPQRDRRAIHLAKIPPTHFISSLASILPPVSSMVSSNLTLPNPSFSRCLPLIVTRERRVSERNHPYNCWG